MPIRIFGSKPQLQNQPVKNRSTIQTRHCISDVVKALFECLQNRRIGSPYSSKQGGLQAIDFGSGKCGSTARLLLQHHYHFSVPGFLAEFEHAKQYMDQSLADGNAESFYDYFDDYFGLKSDQGLDAVFIWNIFHYLNEPQLLLLIQYLYDRCNHGCLLFCVFYLDKKIPARPVEVFIHDQAHSGYLYDSHPHYAHNHFTVSQMSRVLSRFRLRKSFLLGGGVQEMLFEFSA